MRFHGRSTGTTCERQDVRIPDGARESLTVDSAKRDPNVYCDECGAVVEADAADGTRTPCAECGATTQQVRIVIEESVSFHDELRIAAREGEPGEIRPHLLVHAGDSWSHRLRRWLYRTVRIDRANDLYEETVTDPATGETIHHDAGPLSEHRGHGDARRKTE